MTNKTCSRCVMDTSDPDIVFDSNGNCNHCTHAIGVNSQLSARRSNRDKALGCIIDEMKASRSKEGYDCVIGVSGGVDSTYVAYLLKQHGLNPLAVHVDNGWNSELAVMNIENIVKTLNIDLITEVLDWQEFKELQKSFLKASVPHCEHPTDHAIMAVISNVRKKHGIKYFVSGSNTASELCSVKNWSGGQNDWKYIQGIHTLHSGRKLNSFPHMSGFSQVMDRYVYKLKTVSVLDYIEYNKEEAKAVIQRELGWRDYGGKHHESLYTKFFQGYLLPVKFGIDKRKSHYSSLISSGQMTREQAVEGLSAPPLLEAELKELLSYVLKKLDIEPSEWEKIMNSEIKTFNDYESYENSWYFKLLYPYMKRSLL